MLLKCCIQYASKFGKPRSGHRTGKDQFSFQSKRKAMPRMFKLLHNSLHLTLLPSNAQNSTSQASTIRESWTSRCSSWTEKRQRNQKSNWQHLLDHRKSKTVPEKTSTSASLTTLKPLTVWITTNCGKFFKRWEYQTTWPASWEICIRKQQKSGSNR